MSVSAAYWALFAREIAGHRRVRTIRDRDGYPAPRSSDGLRAELSWSSLDRVLRIIERAPAYRNFEPVELGRSLVTHGFRDSSVKDCSWV